MKKGDPHLGHLCLALAYAPNPQLLAVFVLSCKDLKSTDEGGFSGRYLIDSLYSMQGQIPLDHQILDSANTQGRRAALEMSPTPPTTS